MTGTDRYRPLSLPFGRMPPCPPACLPSLPYPARCHPALLTHLASWPAHLRLRKREAAAGELHVARVATLLGERRVGVGERRDHHSQVVDGRPARRLADPGRSAREGGEHLPKMSAGGSAAAGQRGAGVAVVSSCGSTEGRGRGQ